MTDRAKILARVRAIPEGFVRTYADIEPAAPRSVGPALAGSHDRVPWHRVVHADGSVPMGAAQLDLLRGEGVPLRGDRVDLARARLPLETPDKPTTPKTRRPSLATAIAAVAAIDPVMARLVEAAGPIRYRPRDPDGPFGALVRAIMFQQLAGPAANAIHQRLRALVDGPLIPEAVMRLTDDALRTAGLSHAKAASVRDLSAKVLDGTVVFHADARMSDEEIIARLSAVRGIGRWTAEMYLMFQCRRLDIWPVDDLGIRQGYGLAWSIDPAPAARQLEPLGDRFRPYRSVVARYCWEASALIHHGNTALR